MLVYNIGYNNGLNKQGGLGKALAWTGVGLAGGYALVQGANYLANKYGPIGGKRKTLDEIEASGSTQPLSIGK